MPIFLPEHSDSLGTGTEGQWEPGSGLAQPRGLECVWVYNGLVMHDRSIMDKYRIVDIDGLWSPDVRDSREQNPADHGEQAGAAFYGGKGITIHGFVECGNIPKMRDMQQALAGAFSGIEEQPLVARTNDINNDVFVNVRLAQNISMKESQDNQWARREFLIPLRASDPRIFSWIEHDVSASIVGGNVASFNISNRGNFPARPRIILTGPLSGSITVRNLDTGSVLAFWDVESIGSGEYITTEFLLGKKIMTDAAGNRAFGKMDTVNSSRTFEIRPFQTDRVEVTAGSGSGSVQIFWRDTWI